MSNHTYTSPSFIYTSIDISYSASGGRRIELNCNINIWINYYQLNYIFLFIHWWNWYVSRTIYTYNSADRGGTRRYIDEFFGFRWSRMRPFLVKNCQKQRFLSFPVNLTTFLNTSWNSLQCIARYYVSNKCVATRIDIWRPIIRTRRCYAISYHNPLFFHLKSLCIYLNV